MTLAAREQTPTSHDIGGYKPLTSSMRETHFAAKPAAAQQTHFGSQTAAPQIMAFSTRTVTPLRNDRNVEYSRHFVHEAEESLDEITAARDRRLELLARHFVGEASPEDDARFHILTQRLRRLVPSVSDDAWQALDSVTSTLEGVSSSLDELKKQFDFR